MQKTIYIHNSDRDQSLAGEQHTATVTLQANACSKCKDANLIFEVKDTGYIDTRRVDDRYDPAQLSYALTVMEHSFRLSQGGPMQPDVWAIFGYQTIT